MPDFVKKNGYHIFGYPIAALVFFTGGIVQSHYGLAADVAAIKRDVKELNDKFGAVKSTQETYIKFRDEQVKTINERLAKGGL